MGVTKHLVVLVTLLGFLVAPTSAHAQSSPTAPTQPTAPAPTGPVYGGAPTQPYPYPYPQPPPGYAPYPGGSPYPDPRAVYAYEAAKKSVAAALVLEFVVPGIGSVYADHAIGALITWGLLLGGIVVAIQAVETRDDPYGNSDVHLSGGLLSVGLVMMIGGRVYGFVDAYSSTTRYNRQLAARLGLAPDLSLSVAPFRVETAQGPRLAFGPALSLRF